MSDYTSLKVPELKKLLLEQRLPISGNKADLIARLQEHDKSKEPTRENEDEIDYSDDDVPTTTKPAEPAKPVESVPAATEEKPVSSSTGAEPTKESAEHSAAADKPTENDENGPRTNETDKADFSAHLPASNADEEARKRAERAKRFGIVETEEDEKKNARAERFGIDQSSLTRGLDSALPEKRTPKRGREGGNAEGERGAKRQNPGGRHRNKGRFRGRQGGPHRKEDSPAGQKGRSGILSDPAEKAKAEMRAKRFNGGS
ncbi:hypothetical protein F5B19DRAFT_94796 [Rostrohypoxylon terebratum]|nr:hypothetical protein F5B19DRAFT_94796 [Rostrohypoxylon terebratum]